MMLVPDMPPAPFFYGLHLALNLGLAAVLFGYRTRAASLGVGLLFLIGYGFSYSFGKINHNMLFILLPFVMAFSHWGAAYSLVARAGRRGTVQAWPLTLLALFTGFAMFTAGFPKLLGGWLDPSTHAVQGHLISHFFVRGRQDLLSALFVPIRSGLFWESLDWATVCFELGFLPAIFHRATARAFAFIAVTFHFFVMLMLNIAFTFNLIVYAALADWPSVEMAARRWTTHGRVFRPPTWALRLGMVAVGVFFFAAGSPLLLLDAGFSFSSGLTVRDCLAMTAALLLAMGFALRAGAGFRPTFRMR